MIKQSPSRQDSYYKKWVVHAALFVENYLFPILFFYFALKSVLIAYTIYPNATLVLDRIHEGTTSDEKEIILFCKFVSYGFLSFFNILIMAGLIVRKNLHVKPSRLIEIIIPLIATFFYLSYNVINYIPEKHLLRNFLFPSEWLIASCLIGIALGSLGWIISMIATYNLRYSYAILMEVRDVVKKGLYRYVRHPIYLGYFLTQLGLCLIYSYLFFWVVSVFLVGIQIYRALLEEKKLAAFSQEYRDYRKKTPFLIPI